VPGVLELKRRLAHGGITRRQFDRVPAAHVPRTRDTAPAPRWSASQRMA
jgi:hypothetical protein